MSDHSRGLTGDLSKEGYSKEEDYFYHLNRELIERKRHEIDSQKAARRRGQDTLASARLCPNCGSAMQPVQLMGIEIDQCHQCQGVYFDRGELETLFQSREQGHFIGSLWKHLRRSLTQADVNWKP